MTDDVDADGEEIKEDPLETLRRRIETVDRSTLPAELTALASVLDIPDEERIWEALRSGHDESTASPDLVPFTPSIRANTANDVSISPRDRRFAVPTMAAPSSS